MARFLVHQSGPLNGVVTISGAKNSVLPLMAAALLPEETVTISDVPVLRDVNVMKQILSSLGAEIDEVSDHVLDINTANLRTNIANEECVSKMRASFLIMGPLLSRTGYARVDMPGGCTIGARPIDLHLKGFRALGAEIVVDEDHVEAKAPKGGLQGASIYLDFPSVGATENIMMAAVLASGQTTILNAAEEPEIVDLANFLNKMGASVRGAGTDTIKIQGGRRLHGTEHTVIPDRIETGTYMLAGAITRGEVLIKNIVPDHIKPIAAKLRECGVLVELGDEGLYVVADRKELSSTNIKTLPYPGFPTDIQSPFMAFLTTVKGNSMVNETVFENRFMHVSELNSMGARIEIEGNKARVHGGRKLHGAVVRATDLRAGAALALAGLYAEGETEILDIYHIERGYEDFIGKFAQLGAAIERVE